MVKYVLVADIGGTNANFAIADLSKSKSRLALTKTYPSKNIKSFSSVINDFLVYAKETAKFKPTMACIAGAGPVINDEINLTNANFSIKKKEILKNTNLSKVFILNDFDAIGYAINVITKSQYITLNKGKKNYFAKQAVIGAGTGLGKSILHNHKKLFVPMSSEGGHGDLALQSFDELDLVKDFKQPIQWEDVLSGSGISSVFNAVKQKPQNKILIDNPSPKNIASLHIKDVKAKKTIKFFVKMFARCAKNLVLDSNAKGGLWITGGIAAHEPRIFNQGFMKEFTNHSIDEYKFLLKHIPVNVVTDYSISLLGAAYAIKVEK